MGSIASDFWLRLLNIRREEWWPVLLSALFFFCILSALMVLRPAREALGMQRGIEAVRWLFIGTAGITLLVNPVFGWLVSHLRRAAFIGVTYVFFAASLLVFYLLMVGAPEAIGIITGQVFYVWFSVFNLFSVMVFWALMADRFSLEQSKRCFPAIAVGGTLGAIFGPWLASRLASPLGTASLLLISMMFLMLAWALASWIVHQQRGSSAAMQPDGGTREQELIGGSAWEGLRAVCQSRYLQMITVYVVILAVMATFLYFTRLQMVAELESGIDDRTTLFAYIDLVTQVATLVLQLLVSGHIMRRFGVSVALAVLPVIAVLGFLGLALVGSLAVLIVFEAVFRAVQRALMRPARETLFTLVSREEKYKAKAFIDTFVYRGGDVIGAQLEGGLARLAMGLSALAGMAIPLALVWGALGVWLGRAQNRLKETPRLLPDDQARRKGPEDEHQT